MKKLNFFIYPFILGILIGGFVQCCLCFLSLFSPVGLSFFPEDDILNFFHFCGMFSFLLALLIIVVIILNIRFLLNLNSSKTKLIVALQFCAMIPPFLASRAISDLMLDRLYDYLVI